MKSIGIHKSYSSSLSIWLQFLYEHHITNTTNELHPLVDAKTLTDGLIIWLNLIEPKASTNWFEGSNKPMLDYEQSEIHCFPFSQTDCLPSKNMHLVQQVPIVIHQNADFGLLQKQHPQGQNFAAHVICKDAIWFVYKNCFSGEKNNPHLLNNAHLTFSNILMLLQKEWIFRKEEKMKAKFIVKISFSP